MTRASGVDRDLRQSLKFGDVLVPTAAVVVAGRLRIIEVAGTAERVLGTLASGDAAEATLPSTQIVLRAAEDTEILHLQHGVGPSDPRGEAFRRAIGQASLTSRQVTSHTSGLPGPRAFTTRTPSPTLEDPYLTSDGLFPSGRKARKVPFIAQIDEMDCGVACLAMICASFGKRVGLPQLRALSGATTDGTSLRGLCRAASEIGLAARAVKVSRKNLDRMPTPAVLHWRGNHWVVLVRVRGDIITVLDPSLGQREVSRRELFAQWNGYAALFDYTEAFATVIERKPNVRWLAAYVRPYLGVLGIGLGLAFVEAALAALLPLFSQLVIDRVVLGGAPDLLPAVGGALVVTFAFLLASDFLRSYLLSFVAVRVDAATLDALTRRLLALPMAFFRTRRTGDIQRRLEGAHRMREILVSSAITGTLALVQLVVVLSVMASYSWRLLAACLTLAPVYGAFMLVSRRKLKPLFDGLEEAHAGYQSDQLDAIKGVEPVKASGAEGTFRDALLDRFLRVAEKQFRADFVTSLYAGGVRAVSFLTTGVALLYGAHLALAGRLTLGELVAFGSLVALANEPLHALLGIWDRFQLISTLAERLADVFEHEPEQGWSRSELLPVPSLSGRVEVRNMSFSYAGASQPTLRDVSFVAEPGQRVAIVGRSGSGKTTLAKLLSGLASPTEGLVLFDGRDQTLLNHRDLRRHVGFVLQNSHLFEGTILDNIALGDSRDEERAIAVAQLANAHDFVTSFPLGYRTRIGETGIALSGGQAQRVCIARALYKDPRILIFDEATSALDVESEAAIQENLATVFAGRTSFVVAHRVSTVRESDVILVLDRGHIVERGSHAELLARNGLYHRLVTSQVTQ